MGLSFLTPLFLAGLAALAVPVIIHLTRRHRGVPMAFPSIMFLRRLPVRSVRQRQIRDWPLLLVRMLALVLIATAFARPVLDRSDPGGAGEGDAFREVVVLLDRSWSMGLGDRWPRARREVEEVLSGLVAPDRASLIHFDGSATVAVEPTLDLGELRAVLDTLSPGWGTASFGAAVQAASGVLDVSDRSNREVVLVSDFQRRAWEDGPPERLPPRVALLTRDVGDNPVGVVGVTDVSFRRQFVDGRQRIHPQARIVRFGDGEAGIVRLTLRIDEQELELREVVVPGGGATLVELEPFILPAGGARVTLEAAREGERAMPRYHVVLTADEVLTVLLVDRSGAPAGEGLHLRSALPLGGDVPIQVVRRNSVGLATSDLPGAHVLVFDDVPLPGGVLGESVRSHVRDGAGLVVVAGPGSAPAGWAPEWDPVLPGRPGAPVDRIPSRGGILAAIDGDHPVFAPFGTPGRGGLGTARFFRYRGLEVAPPELVPASGAGGEAGAAETADPSDADRPASRVLARFDDGTPALAERRAGEGRVLLWTSSLGTSWSDLPLQAAFVPMVQEVVRYAGLRNAAPTQHMVDQALDAGYLRQRIGSESGVGSKPVLVVPGASGRGIPLDGPGPVGRLDLSRPGFYEVRCEGEPGCVGWDFAVNMHPGAADPARVDPDEVTLAVTTSGTGEDGVVGAPTSTMSGMPGTSGQASRVETERRQGAWRFFLLGALLLLFGETLISNRGRRSNHPAQLSNP